ncbi:hypothetical protein [Hyphomonas sp.]|uniref:hypothetical protein n=1 Tax=Hyphomonas sp. TaxID=87 RepID=UPI00262B7245|nr:hypothetical protein [Hyphomonas sp.]MDF1805275.1 hypothetical protein [Hyphomonas sp.]
MINRFFVLFAASTLSAWSASPETLQMECGPSKGYSYTAAEGQVPMEGSGWSTDQISTGLSVFELDLETGAVRYRWRDARNVWFDAADSASEIRLLSIDETDYSWQMLSNFGSVVEVCSFANVLDDSASSLCVTSRNLDYVHSARTLIASCNASIIASE